jgi:hypothetical protein
LQRRSRHLAPIDSRRRPMPDTSVHDALIAYADAIRRDRAANPGFAGDGTGLSVPALRLLAAGP